MYIYIRTYIHTYTYVHSYIKNCYAIETNKLSNLYNDIIKSLKDAAEVIPTKANNTSSKYTVLGWNELVRDSDQATRESFLF